MKRWLARTPQSVDPVGGVVDTPIVTIGGIVVVLLSIWLTFAHWRDVQIPVAALLGVLLVGAAAIALVAATMPSRAPFTPERLGLIITLSVGATVAEYVSTAGANRFLYDDYGATVTGLIILSLSPFCSWVALSVAGLMSAGVSAILVIGAAPTTATLAPVVSLITVNAAIILSMTAAAAVYSASIVNEVLAWQRETNLSMLRRDAERQAGTVGQARVLPQAGALAGAGAGARATGSYDVVSSTSAPVVAQPPSRVSMLRRQVLPFLAQVTTAERISRADADRARELVEALGQALRAGVEATWLDDLAESVQATHGVEVAVSDRDRDAGRLDDHQRAAVTALLDWLADGGRTYGIRLTVARVVGEPLIRLTVLAERSPGWTPKKRDLDRFVAIARVVGLRARAATTGENVRVEIDDVIG